MNTRYQKQFKLHESLYASTGQRFLNFIIDYVIQLALIYMITFGLGMICEFTGSYTICLTIMNFNTIEEYLFGLVTLFVYYSFFEIQFSQSPGKFVTQTIVVDEFGNKPPARSVLIRSLCRMVPFDGLSFLGGQPGWHDRWANTYVVNKKDLADHKEIFYSLEEIGENYHF